MSGHHFVTSGHPAVGGRFTALLCDHARDLARYGYSYGPAVRAASLAPRVHTWWPSLVGSQRWRYGWDLVGGARSEARAWVLAQAKLVGRSRSGSERDPLLGGTHVAWPLGWESLVGDWASTSSPIGVIELAQSSATDMSLVGLSASRNGPVGDLGSMDPSPGDQDVAAQAWRQW